MNIEENIDQMKIEMIRSVQEIVRIKSVKGSEDMLAPFGEGVNNALLCALNLANSLGFATKNLEGYMGYAEYGQGEEIVGVLGHLDVVDEGSGWTHLPYGGQIHDNKIFGRGTIDDKGPIIAALYGLKAIKDTGLPLTKRVRIMFGTDEESGSKDVEYYLKRDIPPAVGFTPDGLFPAINAEKGAVNIEFSKNIVRPSKGVISIKSLNGGGAVNIVPDFCTCSLNLKDTAKLLMKDTLELYCESNNINMSIHEDQEFHVIDSRGLPSHSSMPSKGKNAITQLIMFLNQFNMGQNDVTDFISFLAKYIGSENNGKSLNINCTDDISGGLTLNLGRISINDDKALAVINIRYPVNADYEAIIQNIIKMASDKKISVSVFGHKKPLYIDKNSSLIKTLLKAYSDVTKCDTYTVSIGGQTYAKSFNNMAAFGPIFPGDEECAHMADEYINIDDLIKCAKIYGKAIYELAK